MGEESGEVMTHFRVVTTGIGAYRIQWARDRWWTPKLKWRQIERPETYYPPVPELLRDIKMPPSIYDAFDSNEQAVKTLDIFIPGKKYGWNVVDISAPIESARPNPGCCDNCVRHNREKYFFGE